VVHGLYIFDFLILVVPLTLWLAPKLKRALLARRDEVRKLVDEARTAYEEAQTRLEVARQRATRIEEEIAALRAEFRDLGERERDLLASEAAAQAARMREEIDFRIAQAAKMAEAEMSEALVRRAFELATGRIRARASIPVPDALVARGVSEIERRGSVGG
jgi:F0F1-type ATP synthase membrane subunit b/b'